LHSSSTPSRSFASSSRSRSLHLNNYTINSTAMLLHHLHHTTKFHTLNTLHHQLTKPTNHLHRTTPLQTPKAHSHTTCNSQLGPPQYRAALPSKYHGNIDPYMFLMCYEATIASAGRDEATLTKTLIISLEDATAN
jgi:hypothetical protein